MRVRITVMAEDSIVDGNEQTAEKSSERQVASVLGFSTEMVDAGSTLLLLCVLSAHKRLSKVCVSQSTHTSAERACGMPFS